MVIFATSPASNTYFNTGDFQPYTSNKACRRKQRGINTALQAAGFQPAFAPRDEELNLERLKMNIASNHHQRYVRFLLVDSD